MGLLLGDDGVPVLPSDALADKVEKFTDISTGIICIKFMSAQTTQVQTV
jgi:hypothetical protein